MKETISKSIYLNSVACSTLGWNLRNSSSSKTQPTLAQQFRMDQGAEIGKRARSLYPTGVFLGAHDLEDAAEETRRLTATGAQSTIFEATFIVDEFVAKADILLKEGTGWHLIEVKSNVNLKDELLDDLAYTYLVASRAGVKISRASLLLISKEFRLGMEPKKLFIERDCTGECSEKAKALETYWEKIRQATSAAVAPTPKLISACKSCDIFSDCLGKGIDNHIFDIPRLSAKKLDALKAEGIFRIQDIPEDFDLTEIQERIRVAVTTNQAWIGPSLASSLSGVKWPAAYLDFETMMMALPPYPETAPYTQIPTQYSIHLCSAVGKVDAHVEYLSHPQKDSRRELAESLIRDLREAATIVTYSSFEKTTVTALASLFPGLHAELMQIIGRMFDLEGTIRGNYYHPAFRGGSSVKVTLPALVPHMSYGGLNIADGDSASATFSYMAMGRYNDAELAQLQKDLRVYCAQDTLAMVKLHERLYQLTLASGLNAAGANA